MDAELKALSKNITLILDSFSQNYDKRVRPSYGKDRTDFEGHAKAHNKIFLTGGDPVVVGVTMYVLSISGSPIFSKLVL